MTETLYKYMKNRNVTLEALDDMETDINFMSQINNPHSYCDGLFTAIQFDNIAGFNWLYNTLNDDDILDFKNCIKNDKTLLVYSIEKSPSIFKKICTLLEDDELLEALNTPDQYENTPMHYLFKYFTDYDYISRDILPLKPDLKTKNYEGESPFFTLIQRGDKKSLSLIQKIVKDDESLLMTTNDSRERPIFISVSVSEVEIFELLFSLTDNKKDMLLFKDISSSNLLLISLINQVDKKIVKNIVKTAYELGILNEIFYSKNNEVKSAFSVYQSYITDDDPYVLEIEDIFKTYNNVLNTENIMEKKILEMLQYTHGKWNNTEKYWEKSKAFLNSKGADKTSLGVLYSVVDLEDVENKKYLEEDPNNLIFMLQNSQNGSYDAFGYNIQGLMTSPDNELFFECKFQGTERISENDYNNHQGKYFKFSLEDPIYLKISFPVDSGQINKYILLENVIGAINSEERVFLIENTEKTLKYSASYHIVKGYLENIDYNIVSADHCQEGTDKIISDIHVCYEC